MRRFPNKYILYILFVFSSIISGCSNRPKDVLSMREMTDVLVDMHKADGIFEMESFRYFDEDEKIKYYNSILQKHEITEAQFDSSVVWYSQDPKKFEKIYGRVITQLTTYDEEIKKQVAEVSSKDTAVTYAEINLWSNDSILNITKDKDGNPIRFVLKDTSLLYADNYVLMLQIRLNTDSCDKENYLKMYIHYADNYKEGVAEKIVSDSTLNKYELNLKAERLAGIDSLSGVFLNPENCPVKDFFIDNISLTRQYNPSVQDSLLFKLELKENVPTSPYHYIYLPNEYILPAK